MHPQAFSIDVTAVLVVLPFAAKNDKRPALNGVLIEHRPDMEGTLAVASNGHAMGIWCAPSVSVPAEPVVINPQGHIIKAMRQKEARLLTFDGSALSVRDQDGAQLAAQLSNPTLDVSFPDWRKALPPHVEPGVKSPVDPKYLALFEKVARVAGQNTNGLFAFTDGGKEGAAFEPVVYRLANCDNFVGVVGSIKYDRPFPLPEWLA